MKILRNREVKRLLAVILIIGVLQSAVCFFISIYAGLISLSSAVLIIIAFIADAKKRYGAMEKLADEINSFLNGANAINPEQYREGEASILACETGRLVLRLREQADTLKKDKLRLADSLADISHQLKTPLTALNLTVEFLKEPDLEKSRRIELLISVNRQIEHIDRLISALLKLARFDADAVTLKKETFALKTLLERSAEAFAVPMEIKGQRLIMKVSGSMTGDLDWTGEAVGNIIKNCAEHSGTGGEIYIEASENPIYSEILIYDSGEGIAEEELPNIFDRFYRGKSPKQTGKGGKGIGIGLALAKTIITRQNGTVAAANRGEGGAIFTVRFYKGIV